MNSKFSFQFSSTFFFYKISFKLNSHTLSDLAYIMPDVPVQGKKRARKPKNLQSPQPETKGQSSTTRQRLPTLQSVSSTTLTRYNLRNRATNN